MTGQQTTLALQRHTDTALQREELGERGLPYRPTYSFAGAYIDAEHERLAGLALVDQILIQLPNGDSGEPVLGWLQRADALKLYELAWFSPGDVLEIGTCHGLSTIVMAKALRAADRGRSIYTVDLDAGCTRAATGNLARAGLVDWVTATTEEAARAIRRLCETSRRFTLAFIDHSHAYDPVLAVCKVLPDVLLPGAFVLMHDYNDPGNREGGEYGVYAAVRDGLSPQRFEFYGIYGCAALFRFRE